MHWDIYQERQQYTRQNQLQEAYEQSLFSGKTCGLFAEYSDDVQEHANEQANKEVNWMPLGLLSYR